jgi:hypothetical protein
MIPLQIVGALFLIGTLIHVAMRWRSGSLKSRELFLWFLVFGGILAVLLFPSVSIKIAGLLGVQRGTDIVVYGSVGLLYFLVFRIYVRLENIQHDLTVVLRELALRDPALPPLSKVEAMARGAGDGSNEA